MGRQQQSLGSAWDQPVEPAVLAGQQQQQPAFAASAAVRSAVAPSAAEEGPTAGEASLSSH